MSGDKVLDGAAETAVSIADNQNDPLIVDLVDEAAASRPSWQPDASLHFADGGSEERLDLADILSGEPGSQNIGDYLLAIDNGSSSTLLVDTAGTGNFANPDLVLEIDGVNWDSGTAGQLAELVTDSVILVA